MAGDVVFDVDIRVPVGRTVAMKFVTSSMRLAVFGPSGCGKTTLLRAIAGVERRAVGRIQFRGEAWLSTEKSVDAKHRHAALVPQDARLFPHLSVENNLRFADRGDDAFFRKVVSLLEIEAIVSRQPRHLSGGEAQRVALGRALLSSPRVLLLDEPFAALDEKRRDRVRDAVAELVTERHIPVVMVAHHAADTRGLADARLTVDDDGVHLKPEGPLSPPM